MEAQVTAALGYAEVAPEAGVQVTAVLGYAEVHAGGGAVNAAQVTAAIGYVEVAPQAGVQVTALLGYAEVYTPTEQAEKPSPPLKAAPLPELYDAQGKRISFMTGFSVRLTWLLNDVGSGELTVPAGEPWVSLLEPDRLVLIRSRYGLADWGGVVIEVERRPPMITARLREAAILLAAVNCFGYPMGNYPSGLPDQQLVNDVPHGILAGAIAAMNRRGGTIMRMGSVDLPQARPITAVLTPEKSILDLLGELRQAQSFDFWTQANFDSGGRLYFTLHLAAKRQRDRRRQVVLWDGAHIGPNSSRKQISTRYGLSPSRSFLIELTDTDLWPYLAPGDLIEIRSAWLDYSGSARILGLEPDEANGVLSLALEDA